MVSNGKCDVGASKITSEILEIVANLPKSVEALTGIDISKVSDIKSETLFCLNYVHVNCTSDVCIFGWNSVGKPTKNQRIRFFNPWTSFDVVYYLLNRPYSQYPLSLYALRLMSRGFSGGKQVIK